MGKLVYTENTPESLPQPCEISAIIFIFIETEAEAERLPNLPEVQVNVPALLTRGFSSSSVGKEPICNVGDLGSIPGLGRSPGEGKGYPLQYCGLEKFMDCMVHGVPKSGT